jgi:upstream activation factor subunit UAF30
MAQKTVTEKKTAASKKTENKSKSVEPQIVEPQTTVIKKEVKSKSKTTQPVVEKTTTITNDVVDAQNTSVTTDSSEISVSVGFTEFIGKFQSLISQFNSLKTELKVLERKTLKQVKIVEKLNNKKKRKGVRAPSGFVKPSPISDELAAFLGKPNGTEMARTDVTREINKYIRANNLQDKDNGRQINPDKELCTLLKIDNEIVLTYFNLQRFMGPHFPKQIKPAEPVVTAGSA